MIRAILIVLVLAIVFCLALASSDPWDIVIGAILGSIVYAIFHDALPAIPGKPENELPSLASRVLYFFPFAAITVWEILIGSVRVAAVVAGLRKLEHPGIVAVPIGERSKIGVVVTGITTSMAPGSIVLDVDWDRHLMLVHMIDAGDPDQVRDRMQHLYDRYQRKVFP